jgi:hypothetical protein
MDCLWGVDGEEISREVVSLAFLPMILLGTRFLKEGS